MFNANLELNTYTLMIKNQRTDLQIDILNLGASWLAQ